MSEFSQTTTSSFPNQNILFNSASGITGQQIQQNQLGLQSQQMQLTAADHEQVGRLAAGLLNIQDPTARAQAYAQGVGVLQSQGLAKYAPPTLPDEQSLRMLVSQTVPVQDQYKMGIISPPGLTDALARASAPPPGYGGTGATATPATTPPGSGATIGQRQNNPGNLTFAGQPGAQPGQGNRFASFPDMPTGVAATADQLALYQQQHGINTVRGAVTRWVSDPKADLTSYIGDISKALGVGPDDKIDLTNPDVQAKFIQAQFPHESAGGGYVLNPADVAKGVQMSAANRGRTVQAPGTAIATAAPATAQPGQPVPTQVASNTPMVSTAPAAPTAAPGAPAQPPATAAAPAQPGQPQPAPAPAATAQPGATPLPGTGVNSQQFQTALWKTQQAALLETQFPNSPAAKAKATELRAEAALYMQADSVITLPNGIQVKALSGQQLDAAKPLPDYRETSPGSGIWVGGPGAEPKFQPPGRLVVTPGGDVYQTTTGGAKLLKPTDPAAVTALEAAKTAGAAAGTATGQLTKQLAIQGRTAGQAIATIDEGMDQIAKAKAGGVNTGYFAPWLTTGLAMAKSIGIPTEALGVDPAAVGNIQTAKKTLALVSGQILQQILGPESQVTEGKINQFIHATPGIETDPQALERVLNWARSQFVYEHEMAAKAMEDASVNNGVLPNNWQAKYFHEHGFAPIYEPTVGEMQQPDGKAPPREPQRSASAVPTVKTDDDYNALKSGTVFLDPNGKRRTKP